MTDLPEDIEVTVVIDELDYPPLYPGENFFGRLARMRQSIIDAHLDESFDDVLWIDADIIDYPADLYQQLRAVHDKAIVSPLVLIEGGDANYDTASFRENVGSRSSASPPYFGQEGPVVELVSVGGCVLMPAWVHREQQFYAQDDEDDSWNTEWLSVCQHAASKSLPILCDTRIKVYHANLPAYGEAFH